jgi:hypothetical protein
MLTLSCPCIYIGFGAGQCDRCSSLSRSEDRRGALASPDNTGFISVETMSEMESESIGQYLQKLRRQKKCSLKKVAQATRIKVENIRAIESDEITGRVPLVYAKGFVKTYAEFMGADSSEVVERFKKLHGDAASETPVTPVAGLVRSRRVPLSRRFPRPVTVGIAAVVAAVILYCLYASVFWPYRVTVRAVGRVPIKVYRDGQFVWGSTIERGRARSWRAKRSIELKIAKPENAEVIYKGRKVSLPRKGTVSVIFDRRGIKKSSTPGLESSAGKGV